MTDLIDRIHFQELSQRDPNDVCRRESCKYDDMNESYILSVWGDEYRIFPTQLKISCMTKRTQGIHDYLYLFMIHYFLQSKETELFNEWISEKDIPGGTTFFRGPHEIPTKLISLRFNNNINEFKARCEQLSEEIDKIPPQTIYMGYHNDPYQPCEAEYHQTRKVLELFLKKGFSASILTKSDLVFAMLIS